MTARVVAERPSTFLDGAPVARPPLSGGAGATFTQWEASHSPAGSLLLGCVATPIPGWVEDMRPAVDARTFALMNSTAERLIGAPVEAKEKEPGLFELRPASASSAAEPALGIARTFVGWDDGAISTCFAICATRADSASAGERCERPVRRARLEGSVGPPPPGVVLGAATWAVHHPTQTVGWGGALAFALGVVAVASRRRPRSRI